MKQIFETKQFKEVAINTYNRSQQCTFLPITGVSASIESPFMTLKRWSTKNLIQNFLIAATWPPIWYKKKRATESHSNEAFNNATTPTKSGLGHGHWPWPYWPWPLRVSWS